MEIFQASFSDAGNISKGNIFKSGHSIPIAIQNLVLVLKFETVENEKKPLTVLLAAQYTRPPESQELELYMRCTFETLSGLKRRLWMLSLSHSLRIDIRLRCHQLHSSVHNRGNLERG
jgi:hypothetical protein